MNRRIAIILDDITQAKKQGLWTQFKDLLRRRCNKKQKRPIFAIENGDALILEFANQQAEYYVEKQYIQLLANGYVRSPLATLVPEENTFFFMKNYKQLYNLIRDLLEVQEDETGTIRIVVAEAPRPQPKTVVHFKMQIKEKITIFERFVKIGWNTYKRQFDFFTGREYIDIDGNRLYIKYDRSGREYLDV